MIAARVGAHGDASGLCFVVAVTVPESELAASSGAKVSSRMIAIFDP